jgi:SAM-dependent methyltransferase
MTRVLNHGNRQLIGATLAQLELEAGTSLLDVGFGGGLALELAHRRGVRRLAGVDPSEAAVARLRERPGRLAGPGLSVEIGTVETLPFPEDAFDAVVSTNTVYFWPDLAPAFAELRRVLRPGGRLALGFSSASKLRSFDAITRHGFTLHEGAAVAAAAAAAGLAMVRLVELHGGDTEGDLVLVTERPAAPPPTAPAA